MGYYPLNSNKHCLGGDGELGLAASEHLSAVVAAYLSAQFVLATGEEGRDGDVGDGDNLVQVVVSGLHWALDSQLADNWGVAGNVVSAGSELIYTWYSDVSPQDFLLDLELDFETVWQVFLQASLHSNALLASSSEHNWVRKPDGSEVNLDGRASTVGEAVSIGASQKAGEQNSGNHNACV